MIWPYLLQGRICASLLRVRAVLAILSYMFSTKNPSRLNNQNVAVVHTLSFHSKADQRNSFLLSVAPPNNQVSNKGERL